MGLIKWAIVLAIGIFIGMSFASANLNDDLRSYYKLDESSGVVVDELGNYDGTNAGATRGVTGILDDAFDFNVNSVSFLTAPLLTNDFSVGIWINSNSLSGYDYAISNANAGDGHMLFQISTDDDNLWIRQYRTAGDHQGFGATSLSTGTWYYVVFVSNSTGFYGYLDGNLEISVLNSNPLYTSGDEGLYLGVKHYSSTSEDYWDGKLDEIGIWERALTESEIVYLYNSGGARAYPYGGSVSLNSPVDSYISPTEAVTFNATAIALTGETLVNMTLYTNETGVWEARNTTSVTGTPNTTTWTRTFSDADGVIWGVTACDTSSSCFFSQNRSFTIDTTLPFIDIFTPVSGSLLNLLKEVGDTQSINFTITDTNLDTCWFEYNGVNTTFGTLGNCNAITPELTAYYRLDELTGAVVDQRGDYNGTITGSVDRGVSGIIEEAFNFSKATEMYARDFGIPLLENDFSVNFWVTTYEASGFNLAVSQASNTGGDWRFLLGTSGDQLYMRQHREGGVSEATGSTNMVYDGSVWYMMTFISNATGSFAYLDGNLEASIIDGTDTKGNTNQGVTFGLKYYNGAEVGTDRWAGKIDEVSFWDKGLSASNIADLYNSGSASRPSDSGLTLANVGTLPFHELTIWANDSVGNTNSDYTTWEYDVFVTNQTWNEVTQEGAVEDFTLNTTLGTGLTFSSATLNYNGTAYGGTITSTGGTDYYVSRTIDIVNVDVTEEHDFYWTLTLSNGNSYNTTTETQNVTSLVIDDCTSYSTMILNYTLYDEDTQVIIPNTGENATIEVNVDISPLGSTTPVITYSNTFESNNATICMDTLDTNYRLDVTTRYSAFDHVVEFHHIQNWQLNSSSAQHISLYDLLITESQEFLVIFKDDNFVLVPDALIDVSREYVGEGVFKSVEVAKTDSQGQTIVHLVLSDVRYDIVVKKEGEILASFDNVVAVCQDVSSGECTLNLNQLATHIEPLDYENIGNIAYFWTLDRDARTIKVDFTSVDSLVVGIDLNVTKFDNFFNESVCSETLTSTTGTITCSIPASFGNVSFLAELYSTDPDVNLVFVGQTLFSLSPSALESFGLAGVIMVIIMFMVLPMMFISSPIGMVFGGIIAIIMMGLLQMFDYGGTFVGTGSMIMWFVIAGLILVWRISKGGKQ